MTGLAKRPEEPVKYVPAPTPPMTNRELTIRAGFNTQYEMPYNNNNLKGGKRRITRRTRRHRKTSRKGGRK